MLELLKKYGGVQMEHCDSFLYSINIKAVYEFTREYLDNSFRVWCAERYITKENGNSSDPSIIFGRYLNSIRYEDEHELIEEIQKIKPLFAKLINERFMEGLLNESEYGEALELLMKKNFIKAELIPLIYVIDRNKVGKKLSEVGKERANENSIEYRIVDLRLDEFDIIDVSIFFRNLNDNYNLKLR